MPAPPRGIAKNCLRRPCAYEWQRLVQPGERSLCASIPAQLNQAKVPGAVWQWLHDHSTHVDAFVVGFCQAEIEPRGLDPRRVHRIHTHVRKWLQFVGYSTRCPLRDELESWALERHPHVSALWKMCAT
jgi:hypothetical protein